MILLFGGLGSLLRYRLDLALPNNPGEFPRSTILVNVLGSFAIGLLFKLTQDQISQDLRLYLSVGLLGGFTTFSAFSLQSLLLLQDRWQMALLYIGLSLGLGLIACWGGLQVARFLT